MIKSLFKSLKFTIAFIVMLIIIIVLAIVLISFLPKNNSVEDFEASQIETIQVESEEETIEETIDTTKVAPTSVTDTDEHTIPLMNEEIAETGSLTINEEMETTGGIIFHKNPVFDSLEVEGNIVNYRGTYNIIGKLFVMYQEKPTIMYHTSDGYYVTSNTEYVTYKAESVQVKIDSSKVATYGYNDSYGLILTIYADDGNHLIFTLSTDDETKILENVIAEYDAFGTATFEYVLDGVVEKGEIEFVKEDSVVTGIKVTFAETVLLDTQETQTLTLSK